MYKAFYGLSEDPFSIAPNPHFLFLSNRHREALAHLSYGLGESGGFVLLTGEVGTGKTTVSRCLLNQLPKDTDTAFILNPSLTALELLATVCDEFNIDYGESPSLKILMDHLSYFLLNNHHQGRNTLLIIDEAQHLHPQVLEQLRLLTNLETDTKKLLQIILIGQPELQALLKRQELRQLAQRITARYHLLPLNVDEVALYVAHRLQVAGRGEALFSVSAIKALHQYSGGIPRLINLLCERALMAGYAQSSLLLNATVVKHAASEVLGTPIAAANRYVWPCSLVAIFVLVFSSTLILFADNDVNATSVLNKVGLRTQPNQGRAISSAVMAQPEIPAGPLWQLQQAIDASRNIDSAFDGLLYVWDKVRFNGLTPCQSAQEQGLTCYRQQGSWRSLSQLNYPAVVHLVDGKQQYFYGVVVAIQADELLLQLSEQQFWVNRAWFTRYFTGTFEIIWQAPYSPMKIISRQSSKKQLQWLENALAEVAKRPARQMANFDDVLERDVKTFQRQQGLSADGIAGSQTLLRLNLYLNAIGPRLTEIGS